MMFHDDADRHCDVESWEAQGAARRWQPRHRAGRPGSLRISVPLLGSVAAFAACLVAYMPMPAVLHRAQPEGWAPTVTAPVHVNPPATTGETSRSNGRTDHLPGADQLLTAIPPPAAGRRPAAGPTAPRGQVDGLSQAQQTNALTI